MYTGGHIQVKTGGGARLQEVRLGVDVRLVLGQIRGGRHGDIRLRRHELVYRRLGYSQRRHLARLSYDVR